MKEDCQTLVSSCVQCQRYNFTTQGYHPLKSLKALLPLDHICIDLKQMTESQRGNNFYLTLVDVATRFVFLRALKDNRKHSVAQELLNIFCDIGFPKILQMDNGAEMINDIMEELITISKIDRRLITPYHKRSNGIAEIVNRTTSEAIFKMLDGHSHLWDNYLASTQLFHNLKVHSVHGSTPYSLMFGRPVNGFQDYQNNTDEILSTQDIQRRLTFLNGVVYPAVYEKVAKHLDDRQLKFLRNNRVVTEDLLPGTPVMIRRERRSAKDEPRYEGPVMVTRRKASGNYELKGSDGSTYVQPLAHLKVVSQAIINYQPGTVAAVEKILDHKVEDGKDLYFVKWEKLSANLNSWVKHADFNASGKIADFHKQRLKDLKINTPALSEETLANNRIPTQNIPQRIPSKKRKPTKDSQNSQNSPTVIPKRLAPIPALSLDQNGLGPYWHTADPRR
jgi:transposase InsO family protein